MLPYLSVGIGLTVLIGLADYVTGYQFGFSIFYLAPIAIVTWNLGRKAGFWLSVICAVVWFFADFYARNSYSNLLIPYWNAGIRFGFFLVVVHLLSKTKTNLTQEKSLARTDPLTGIRNRRAFFELAEMEISRCRRYDRALTVVYLDCDDFKRINDEFEHEMGDALICFVAEVLQKQIRAMDIAARIGGDEFAILLPETKESPARDVVNRLRWSLLETMNKNGWPVTFSIGVATFLNSPDSVESMMKRADELMCSAKREGKNTIKQEVFGKDGLFLKVHSNCLNKKSCET